MEEASGKCGLHGRLHAHMNGHGQEQTAQPRCSKHKRNRSEPISPQQRAALSAMDMRDPAAEAARAKARGRLAPMQLHFSMRRPPEWTERSAKMLACALASLVLLLFTASISRHSFFFDFCYLFCYVKTTKNTFQGATPKKLDC